MLKGVAMKDIPLKSAMVAWNNDGMVMVCEHPDADGESRGLTQWYAPYLHASHAAFTPVMARLLAEAIRISIEDKVPIQNIHKAMCDIPEYREAMRVQGLYVDMRRG